MRPRTAAELSAADRLKRVGQSAYVNPRLLREALRELLETTGMATIRDILLDPDTENADRLRALDLAYRYGVGSQIGLVDADNESMSGVIALPALRMAQVQADASPVRVLPAGELEPAAPAADVPAEPAVSAVPAVPPAIESGTHAQQDGNTVENGTSAPAGPVRTE